MTDIDMILMIEGAIRGGISNVFKRYSKANNKYLPTFDASKESNFIVFLDCVNLYGFALSRLLPISGFKWIDVEMLNRIDWKNIDEYSSEGYILEIDLHYPKEMHDYHDNFPLAPQKIKINNDALSEFQLSIIDTLKKNGHTRVPTEKLMTTLIDKKKYVIHSSVLKFYLNNGLVLERVHKGISFTQKAWLRPYIELNSNLRKESKNEFEKNFFKLMCNAVFGKSIEQKRSHRDIKIALTQNKAKNLIKQPSFKKFSIIDEDKVIIEMNKTKVFLDRPIHCGFTCLELSKLHMYTFYYSLFKKIYEDKCSLLMSDTDSLLMDIKTDDIFKDFELYSDLLDLSEYPSNHISNLKNDSNKKVLGVLKDEMKGELIEEFVGVKSKMYSIKTLNDNKLVGKGIQRQILKKCFNHEIYKSCLFDNKLSYAKMRSIRSKNHDIHSLEQNRLAISPLDDKRYYVDPINSFSFGNYKINNQT